MNNDHNDNTQFTQLLLGIRFFFLYEHQFNMQKVCMTFVYLVGYARSGFRTNN